MPWSLRVWSLGGAVGIRQWINEHPPRLPITLLGWSNGWGGLTWGKAGWLLHRQGRRVLFNRRGCWRVWWKDSLNMLFRKMIFSSAHIFPNINHICSGCNNSFPRFLCFLLITSLKSNFLVSVPPLEPDLAMVSDSEQQPEEKN